MAEWIDRMRGVEVASVAAALGHAVRPSGSSITVSPCPACKAERRHEKRGDKRGAVGIRKRVPGGWKCHACGITGDAIHFVALSIGGRKFGELDDVDRARVREWCVEYSGGRVEPRKAPVAIAAAAEPVYPPAGELRAVWEAAVPVTSSGAVYAWLLEERGIVPALVDARLARVLERTEVPAWACFKDGTPYPSRGYRLLLPMFDAHGRVRSLIFRRTHEASSGPKSVPPYGFERVGLVMASPGAHRMLRSGRLAVDRLVIAEGEMAFLAWSVSSAIATLGIVSGSWTPELAARIPDGARVLIATHPDETGARYATAIIRSLADRARAGRIVLERWKGAAA